MFKPSLERAAYLRNFVFGVEDSLVSTVGLLSGIALVGLAPRVIFLTGLILIVVEAFSMAVGSFLSETSAADYLKGREVTPRGATTDGLIMFFSYLISGLIPLLPYLLLPVSLAFRVSVILSLVALFLLGWFGSRLAGLHSFHQAWRMALLGGLAILVGILVGRLGQNFKI